MMTAPWDKDDGSNVVQLDAWRGMLLGDDKGKLDKKFSGNFRIHLQHHPVFAGRLRYNRFTDEVDVGDLPWRNDGKQWRPICDADIVRIREWLQRAEMTPTLSETADAIFAAANENSFDPVADFLRGLQWDYKPRLDRWLVDLCGAKDTQYIAAVGRKWLISAVARALNPGCKVDTMLVLEGAQGIGKSTVLRILAGDEHFTEFTADLHDDKRFIEQVKGKWIVEFAELATMGKADVGTLKALMTLQVDRARMAYARTVSNAPRRCVLAATVNPRADRAYLTDETGNRRFWPVACNAVNVTELRATRDQLWAEAVARFNEGEQWWLSDEETAIAEMVQISRVAVHPWQDVIGAPGWLADQSAWSSVEILSKLGVTVKDQTHSYKIVVSSIMRNLGWVNKLSRSGSRVAKLWQKAT